MRFLITTAIGLSSIASVPALAQDVATIVPAETGTTQIVRYARGLPYTDIVGVGGVVRVMPLGIENGSMRFQISVLNNGDQPANFRPEDVSIVLGRRNIALVTHSDLVRRANRRRGFRSLMANVGAALQGAGSNQGYVHGTATNVYGQSIQFNGTVQTPLTQGQRYAIEDQRQGNLAAVDNVHRNQIANANQNILRPATIQARQTHTGVVVLERVTPRTAPQHLDIVISWNGESFPFRYAVSQ